MTGCSSSPTGRSRKTDGWLWIRRAHVPLNRGDSGRAVSPRPPRSCLPDPFLTDAAPRDDVFAKFTYPGLGQHAHPSASSIFAPFLPQFCLILPPPTCKTPIPSEWNADILSALRFALHRFDSPSGRHFHARIMPPSCSPRTGVQIRIQVTVLGNRR